jgi:hypothetical protein
MSVARVTEWLSSVGKFRVKHRRETTESHLNQEAETATSLGLMSAAQAAGADMTDEQAIFLSASAKGMRDRIAVLLGIPDRSLAQERELTMIQRELARLEGRPEPEPAQVGIRRFLPAVAAPSILLSPVTWIAAAFALVAAWGGWNHVRAGHLENQRDEARADLAATERHLAAAQTERDLLAERAAAADAQSIQTAANIEAERARRTRTERELRRIRDAMAEAGSDGPIDYGFGRVRDAGEPPAAAGDSAGPAAGDTR